MLSSEFTARSVRDGEAHTVTFAKGLELTDRWESGVNEKNAAEFIKAGCIGLGVGGMLVNGDLVRNGELDKISALAREYIKAVH